LQNNIFQKKLESPTGVGIVADRRLPKNAGRQMNKISYNFCSFIPKTHIYKVDFCFLAVKLVVETQGFQT